MVNSTTGWVGTILFYIGMGLSIAAQVNREWTVILTSGTQHGLYQTCVSGICTNQGWAPGFDVDVSTFVLRIILLVGDVLIACSFVASFISHCIPYADRKGVLITMGVLNILAGSLTIIGMITYTVLMFTSGVLSTFLFRFYFGFCYAFGWASGILFLVGGILQIVASDKKNRVSSSDRDTVWSTNTQYETTRSPGQPSDYAYYNNAQSSGNAPYYRPPASNQYY